MKLIQPFAIVLVLAAIGFVQFLVGFEVQGQEIPRDEYLRYIPLKHPAIVRQTKASDELDLFGDIKDPVYQDTDPVDGIDDYRREVLLDLAVQFAPYLVLNSTMIPMDFRLFIEREEAFPLFIDRWNVYRNPPKLIGSEEIDWQDLSRPTSEAGPREACADIPDCRLLSLLEEFDPFAPGEAYRFGAVAPERVEYQVMFFDFPGDGEETWKQEYVNQISEALPQSYENFAKVFVHPFVESTRSSVTGHQGYAFVLQYWFFYPYNDGFNNHEGDWEHINVFIKPRDKLHEPLSKTDIRRILTEGGSSHTAQDRLVIQRVDYYFHHKVMTVDYTQPNVYQPREEWERELEDTKEERLGEEWIWRQVRHRAYWNDAETIINTHPIGFIGGDNKGTDQLLKHPGGSNRVSNGTFPFSGLYKNVGQVGAIEQISQRFDHREYFAAGDHKREIPKGGYRRGSVVGFASPDRIEILPDGERVMDLIKKNAQARRDWAWLVLPIRWGYPATESPFAGAITHTDLGNSSVLGPSYNTGWNRSGNASGFQMYSPHTFGPLFRLTLQDSFINNLGYLNLPLSSLTALPPFDIGWRLISMPFRSSLGIPDRIFQPKGPIPYRYLSVQIFGVTRTIVGPRLTDFILNSMWRDAIKSLPKDAFDGVHPIFVRETPFIRHPYILHSEITLYLGERFVSQNWLRFGYPTIGYNLMTPKTDKVSQLRGNLNHWEYSGSLRYNLTTGSLITFVKAGYGLRWYWVKNVSFNGKPFPALNSNKLPLRLLPNTWHLGGGIEWMLLRNMKFSLLSTDVGIRGEAVIYRHYLNTAVRTQSTRFITASVFNLALTMGF